MDIAKIRRLRSTCGGRLGHRMNKYAIRKRCAVKDDIDTEIAKSWFLLKETMNISRITTLRE